MFLKISSNLYQIKTTILKVKLIAKLPFPVQHRLA